MIIENENLNAREEALLNSIIIHLIDQKHRKKMLKMVDNFIQEKLDEIEPDSATSETTGTN